MLPEPLPALARATLARLESAGLRLATAESCTGGLIAGCLTAIPGSSAVVERGFVTYSNEAKTDMLGVSADLIGRVGAVSAEVAEGMATGALDHSRADIAVSVTGIAGPDGGTPTKPVGLVYLGVARRGGSVRHERHIFSGDRDGIRQAAVVRALELAAGAV
jgi:nicotinamide-nucleotide amidase